MKKRETLKNAAFFALILYRPRAENGCKRLLRACMAFSCFSVMFPAFPAFSVAVAVAAVRGYIPGTRPHPQIMLAGPGQIP